MRIRSNQNAYIALWSIMHYILLIVSPLLACFSWGMKLLSDSLTSSRYLLRAFAHSWIVGQSLQMKEPMLSWLAPFQIQKRSMLSLSTGYWRCWSSTSSLMTSATWWLWGHAEWKMKLWNLKNSHLHGEWANGITWLNACITALKFVCINATHKKFLWMI